MIAERRRISFSVEVTTLTKGLHQTEQQDNISGLVRLWAALWAPCHEQTSHLLLISRAFHLQMPVVANPVASARVSQGTVCLVCLYSTTQSAERY